MLWRTSTAVLVFAALVVSYPSIAPANELFWTDFNTHSIHGASFSDYVPHTLVQDTDNTYRIALDQANEKMYWTIYGHVRRANLDGTEVETVINTPGDMPLGVAVDSAHSRLYWTESNHAYRANLDGTGIEELGLSGSIFQDLTLDLENGHIYVSDWAGNPNYPGRILQANLDGSSVTTVLSDISRGPVGIGADPVGGKVYWANFSFDPYVGGVQRVNMDGTGVEDLVTGHSADALTLDLTDQQVYWTGLSPDGTSGAIWRAGLDGSAIEALPIPTINPAGVALIPEPSSLTLLVCATISLLARHRRVRLPNR